MNENITMDESEFAAVKILVDTSEDRTASAYDVIIKKMTYQEAGERSGYSRQGVHKTVTVFKKTFIKYLKAKETELSLRK